MKLKRFLALWGMALAMCVVAGNVAAQGGGAGGYGGGGYGGGGYGGGGAGGYGPGGGGGGFGPGGGGGGFGRGGGINLQDPQAVKQLILDAVRPQFEVTDDAEWSVIGDQISKVVDALGQNSANAGTSKLVAAIINNRTGGAGGGGPNGGGGRAARFAGGGGMGGMLGGNQPDPEGDALQQAIDNKASPTELKAAIAKVMEARKAKLAKLQKAQDDLRKLLSVRQEAVACSLGLL